MNKNSYRTIFSQVRGMFVAVAETVKSKTKQAGQSQSNAATSAGALDSLQTHFKKLKLINFAIISLLGASIYSVPLNSIADSQIVADRTAPNTQQATILKSSNGVNQVNIQTPSAGGVSRNTYSQFDVGQEGAILNNSRNNTQTQIGGWVQGNPWLASGEARVILNEVNSSNPSQLKGYIEVAGQKAQVVIANPSGLVCDGCGVINADRFTLTTGQAVMNQGYLESFRVREGQVTIAGKGLNGSLTPYTDIYSRALNVNAGLYANTLNVTLGQNDVKAVAHTATDVRAVGSINNSTPAPQFALDVGQLGGMYAGKIFLLGTEAGVGARNAGSINSTQSNLTLDVNGDLTNSGNMIANKDRLQLNARDITNSGNISSTQHQIQIQANNFQNNGLIATTDEIKLTAQENINNNGVINAGRIEFTAQNLSNDQGKIEQTGQQLLAIQAKNLDNSKGLIGQATKENIGTGESSGGVTPAVTDPQKQSSAQDASTVVIAPTIDSTPKVFEAGQINITNNISNTSGHMINSADITLKIEDNFKNNGGEIQLPNLQFNGQKFENQEGKLSANVINITAQHANNQKGSINASERFDLTTQGLNNNEGRLQSGKALNVTATKIDNTQGKILANDALTIDSDQSNNSDGVVASVNASAQLNIKTLENNRGEISAQNIQLDGQNLNNHQGSIQARTGDLSLTVDQIDNGTNQDSAGNLIAGKQLDIKAQRLNSTGQIYAGDTASLTVKQLQQDGQLAALNKIKVKSDGITSKQNAIWAAGLGQNGKLSQSDATLNINAQHVQIAGKVLSGSDVQIDAVQSVDLSLSENQAKNIKVQTKDLKTESAKFIADQQLDLTATQNIDNQKGQYSANQINIDTKQLNNDQGLIQQTGKANFRLNIADRVDNNAGKIISNADYTEINTAKLNSIAGEILHAGNQQLNISTDHLEGQQGKIQSNSLLQLDTGIANLNGATTTAQGIQLKATNLSHQQGRMVQSDADGQLFIDVTHTLNNTAGIISGVGEGKINAGDLNNQQGVIQTLADKDLAITANSIENASGKVIVGGNAHLQVGQLNNNTGTIYTNGKLDLQAEQNISNQQGLMAAKQALSIKGQNLNNQKGQIQSEQSDVNLNLTQSINNQSGSIQSVQALNVKSLSLENTSGQLISGAGSQINVTKLNNQAGTIYSKKQLDMNVSTVADNSTGIIAAEHSLNVDAQQLLNDAGQIRSKSGNVTLHVANNITNKTGLIAAGKDLKLIAQDVQSQKGKLQSGAHARIQVKNLDNTEGVVYAAEQLKLNTTDELNNSKGVIAAEQRADITANAVKNDAGLIRSQQDQLKLNIKNELSNLAGEISASKAIDLTANTLNNQNGKVIAGTSLHAMTQQTDNVAGIIYAQDQLDLNVADQLNNQSGTIVANQQAQIKANNLNNNAGKTRSEQNQLDLNIQQTLNNQGGEIFAGKNTKLNTAVLNNQQGVIYGKNQIALSAEQLNNQQGQVYSAGSATLTVQGDIQNKKGVLVAEKNLNVQSQTVDNTEGNLRSEKADLILNVQGQLINQQGDIYAGQDANLNSVGVDNKAGQIAAQNQLSIDTQQQQLNNQDGKIIAKVVELKTGALANQTGLIQGEQSVKVDTQNHALLNNNSGDKAGILSQGNLEIINTSQLDNTSGYIAAVGPAHITTQNLNNNTGQINSQADLNIHQLTTGGRIDNLAGKIQAQQNVTLHVDQMNNSGIGSHIVAGEKLSIEANKIDNSLSKDSTVLGGLDGKTIEINAQELDNQEGVIRASQDATLNIQNQLSNQLGSISSLDSLSVGTASKTLNVNNTGGELLAKNQLNLKANELINKGKIISEGNVDIDLKQSYTHTQADQISANKTLKLTTEQDLINQSELSAGQKIELTAKNIQNQKGASISSNETHLTAQETVHNQGLINGELTYIQADRVWNDGARIYGTHVAIQANTLDNKSNTAGTGAVIASRGDMDLGVGTLNNQSGGEVKDSARDNAWIFSSGNLNVGGRLDGNLKTQGQAQSINNLSARIESLGDMTLAAKNTNNTNLNFKVAEFQVGGVKNKVYIQPEGKTTKIPKENLIWANWSRAGLYKYNTKPNVLPENVILGETPIPNVESINCVGIGDNERCSVNYKKDDAVWAYFKITPPAKDAPSAPTMIKPIAPTGQASCEAGAGYDEAACMAYQTAYTQYEQDKKAYQEELEQYKKDLDAWDQSDESAYQALSDAIDAYNSKFNNSEFKNWTQYEVKETKFKSEVTNSAPAEIVAGGNINLYGDAFKNDKSTVLAGGTLNVQLNQGVEQIDGKGVEITKQTGTSQYSYSKWRGGFKRYYQRKWGNKVAYSPADEVTEIDLPVNQWLGNVKNHTSNQNISTVTTVTVATPVTDAEAPEQQQDRQQQSQTNQITVGGGTSVSAQGNNISVSNTSDQLGVAFKKDQNIDATQQRGASVDSAQTLKTNDVHTSAANGQGEVEIRSVSMDFINVPSNALFSTSQDSQAHYLVVTDPAFSNYKKWLSSDYMLSAMNIDPATKQKRLGDGYYEQRLVQDQIAQLTGRRFLQGYASDEEQYKALMNSALSFAKLYNLTPGIALTATQVAQLTTDIVWLEETTIKLADGTTTQALVPKVYVKARAGDLKGDGTLISADQVNIQVKGDVLNNATIAGREALRISADNINQLSGRMQANNIALNTTKDLNNIGGTMTAVESANLNVGGNFNQSSTTQKTTNQVGKSEFTREGFDRKAGVYITGTPLNQASQNTENLSTTLAIHVAGNTNLKGSEIVNSNGSSSIQTKGNLTIGGVNTSLNNHGYADKDNFNYEKKQEDIGSVIRSSGNTRLQAENITVTGSQVSSKQGSTVLAAQKNIDISEGRKLSDTEQGYKVKEKGMLSTTVRQGHVQNMSDEAIASTIDGKSVILDADNIKIQGSDVVSDALTQIQAKENVTITNAQNQYLNYSESSVKKSGLMGTGGIGFSIGSKKEKTDQRNTTTRQTGSTVGSLTGNTTIVAGDEYRQIGSTVSAPKGDIHIQGKQVNIEAAQNQNNSQYQYEMQQKGLTLAVNVPVVSAVQSAIQSTQQVGQSKNDRVNAMAAANSAYDGYKAGKALSGLKDVANATNAKDMAKAANVSATITYGQQKTTQNSETQNTTASGSQVIAGGKAKVVATGSDQSTINIIGSDVMGQQGTQLLAENHINIQAAEQNSVERSSNKSEGFNIGAIVSAGKEGIGYGVTAGANQGKGHGNGNSTSYLTSHVGSQDSQTVIQSGNTTNIIGGQVQGKGVTVNAKDLNIESLQDTATYQSKQQNIEGQATVMLGGGGSVSGSASQSKINANYASVQDQAGIYAGDDGYQINVKHNTDLKGAIITSKRGAETNHKNSLSTGTLTSSDLHNISEYDAKGIGVSAAVNVGSSPKDKKQGDSTQTQKVPNTVLNTPDQVNQQASSQVGTTKSIGFGLDSDKASSVTKSGVNTSNITITEQSAQQALTGKTAEQTKADILTATSTENAKENSGALKNNFDKDKVQSEINLQVDVTKKFDANRQEAKQEINKKLDDLKEKNKNVLDKEENKEPLTDQEKAQLQAYYQSAENYQNLGLVLDTVSAGLSAPTSSGLGIAAATLSPKASYEIGQYFKRLAKNNADGNLTAGQEAGHILAHGILAAAVAGAGGNDALTVGLAAGGSEAAIPIVSKYWFGKKTSDLTADEKGTISAIVGLAGAGIGATTGDVASMVQSGQLSQNAVENNSISDLVDAHLKGKTLSQVAEDNVKEADELYRKNNCAGLSARACDDKMYAERKDVLWLATGFIPVIGDIQTLAQAKSAGDVLWAMVGVIPVIGEYRQAYKVAEKAGDLAGMKKALEQGAAIATQKGYVNKTKVTVNQTALKVNSKADQALVTKIAKGEDRGGELTEQLFNSLAKQNGFTVVKGGKYGSNNGFDHIWIAKDGSVTILADSKQITNGTVKLESKAAGGNTQLSEAWIQAVVNKLDPKDPARLAIEQARETDKLKTAVTGVDRATGQAVIIPVHVPAKSKPTVKK